MSEWHSTASLLPPEGTLVEVPNNGGMILKYSKGLWFMEDGMYVYFTPEYWRAV